MSGETPYMTLQEAADYLRVSKTGLRRLGLGVRLSPRRTVYRKEDLDNYVREVRDGVRNGQASGGSTAA